MSAAFELVDIPCLFFNRHGKVTLYNTLARRYIGHELKIADGIVRTPHPQDGIRLNRRLKAMLAFGMTFNGGNQEYILINREDSLPLIVRLFRLKGHLHDHFAHSCVVGIIMDPVKKPVVSRKLLAKLFGLTATEVEVALLFANGRNALEIAAMRQASYETVRSHLKSIFRKTGTNRQSELAALVGRFASR